ncbi:hypothetical protein GQX74_003248 [Glossina fuscipes]|nr:hypothetical protein GQX74_003248 [Glossina fuscipes]
MMERAKALASISRDTYLDVLRLRLGGHGLEELLSSAYPTFCMHVVSKQLVASIQLLYVVRLQMPTWINSAGSCYNCDGWDHFIGDEGDAFHISHRPVKILFDDTD